MTYLLTDEDRVKAQSVEAREKRRQTEDDRRRYQGEDVLLLRKRGMVPLAIADELGVSLRRVMLCLTEAGESVPGYLITSSEPVREPCRRCGRD